MNNIIETTPLTMFISHLLCALAVGLLTYTVLLIKIDTLKSELSNLQINYNYLERFVNYVNDRLNLLPKAKGELPPPPPPNRTIAGNR